jgi:carbon-monoxide dehydrogenase large subunit
MSSVPLQVQFDPSAARFGASRSQKRLEDDRLLLGKGLFSDDRVLPRQVWMVIVRSPHAHAKILSIDLKVPGVIAAWSMADLRADKVGHIPFPPLFKRADGSPMAAPARTPLAEGKVFYVGQPVAAIVAETREAAQDAAGAGAGRLRDARLRRRPAPGGRARGAAPPGERQYRRRSQIWKCFRNRQAFSAAAHVTEIELHNQRLNAMAMEPRCAIGVHEGGRTTLYTQNQTPTSARDLLGAVFGAKPTEFRLVNGDLGGGFGMKTGLTPEDALVCYAARKLGRPVKWRGDRSEEFLAAHMARDQHYRASLALDREGRILALRMESHANIGAVPVGSSAMIPLAMVAKVQTSVYRVPVVDYRIKGVLTNTMATGAYRGAGRPEGNYLIERLVEKAAREMKIDPAEMRRRNFLRPRTFPTGRTSARPTTRASSRRCSMACSRSRTGSDLPKEGSSRRRAAGCAAAGCRPISSGPARCRPRPSTSRSTRRATSRCSPARRRWGRGWRPATRSWSSRFSGFPSTRSGSCRAIPTGRMASAASGPGRLSSADRQSFPPPGNSS